MDLSVVVPTLNAREQLSECLDALAAHAPETEVIVVNGPSADGTTGLVRDRDDVDVLVELAERTVDATRNAGIDRATGDAIAIVDHTVAVTDGWATAATTALSTADVVTGPTTATDSDVATPERRTIAGREVTYFTPGNVAFRRELLSALDGYDESLSVGGSRDLAHRIAANEFELTWAESMRARHTVGTDGGDRTTDWGAKYHSLAYRLVKNYGLRPTVVRRLLSHASGDLTGGAAGVARGEHPVSWWFTTSWTVFVALLGGSHNGVRSWLADRTPRRNPHGRSSRPDPAVTVYDWR